MIWELYANQKASIITARELPEPATISRGIRQRGLLLMTLFNIHVEFMLAEVYENKYDGTDNSSSRVC